DGHVDRGEVTRGAGVRFRAATREPGVYRVEILAESKLGTTVIANFPVYVGVAVPERVTITTASARDDEASDEVRVQHVLDLVNGERARAGVSPLVLDRALSSVALAHDADMIANGFIGHTSPTTGTAAERVARAGIRTDLVLENIGRGYSLQEVHDGLLASPGHRANLVNPQATNVGIGVATERDHERTAYVVTEVFTRVSKKLDENAAHALLDAVNRTRAARGLTELRGDAALDAIAMRTARGYFTAPTSSDAQVMAHAQAELSKPSARPRRIGAVLTVVGSVDDLVTLEALANPAAKSVGIGLAQGTRPGGLPNAICAVLLIAE
ncbi:MAG TPA: CAP domain-containing protein, partial [Polyangiales bacterium]|nr:CAP domain-containing protein [Polyangiales bacterium]